MNKPEKIEKVETLTSKQAFIRAVQEAKNAGFNATNPHFKSSYANEKACKLATDPALNKHGLVMVHKMAIEPMFHLKTQVLDDECNVVVESLYPLSVTKPQDMGSQITYARRYNRCALMGIIADEDDDGNAAQESKLPPSDMDFISNEQVKILKGLIKATSSNEALFLEAVHAESLDKIPVFNFDVAKEKLLAKQKQMKGNNNG